jgi:hypothetical protein
VSTTTGTGESEYKRIADLADFLTCICYKVASFMYSRLFLSFPMIIGDIFIHSTLRQADIFFWCYKFLLLFPLHIGLPLSDPLFKVPPSLL